MKLSAISLSLILLSSISFAGPMEDNFNQAAQAFNSQQYEKAAELFTKAGDIAAKSDVGQASLIWKNAAIASMKAQKIQNAEILYEKILSHKKNLDPKFALGINKDLLFVEGQLGKRVSQINNIDNLTSSKTKLSNEDLSFFLATKANAYKYLEIYDLAIESLDKAISKLPKKGSEESLAQNLINKAICQLKLGRYAESIESFNAALKIAEKIKYTEVLIDVNGMLGVQYFYQGDYDKAFKFINKALDIATKHQDKFRRKLGIEKNNLALVYKSLGKNDIAMKLINESLSIATEVKNESDYAIALVNRAVLYRSFGDYKKANTDYFEALKRFEKAGFKEGAAGAHTGIGKMLVFEKADYENALEHYKKALDLFKEIQNPRGEAEVLLFISDAYKVYVDPKVKSKTRDLSFVDDEDESSFNIAPDVAKKEMRNFASQALDISTKLQLNGLLWSSHQNLGYVDFKEGNLESSFEHYQKAIDIVSKMNLSSGDVEKFGEFMAGKEDLYSEAQQVCNALYKKTNDEKYMQYVMQYADTLKNEVQKASAKLANIKYEDPNKQKLFDALNKKSAQISALQNNVQLEPELTKNSSAEDKSRAEILKKSNQRLDAEVKQLNEDYEKLLAQWSKEYPEDQNLFEAQSRIDYKMIQDNLSDSQVALQYTMLPDALLISVISNKGTKHVSVDVSRDELDKLIKNEFNVAYIEGFGREYGDIKDNVSLQHLLKVSDILSKLYGYLIKPIADDLDGKDRLYIIADGYLSQTPFSALVTNYDNDGNVDYLIEKYDISYIRPSFLKSIQDKPVQGSVKKLLAVANPDNKNFQMPQLAGTVSEIINADQYLADNSDNKADLSLENNLEDNSDNKDVNKIISDFKGHLNKPSETWLREKLAKDKYEVLYFATHGMPYSNVLSTLASGYTKSVDKVIKQENEVNKTNISNVSELISNIRDGKLNLNATINVKGKDKKILSDSKLSHVKLVYTKELNLSENSPLNGFLYLSSTKDHDVLKEDVDSKNDGLLTVKEIYEMPDSYFDGTKYVILSACNTAVTTVSGAMKAQLGDDASAENSKSSEEVLNELKRQGYVPGVDQVSFIDTFMKKKVHNVFGNYWFVDDLTSSIILSNFTKNLKAQGDNTDAVKALNDAQRQYLKDVKNIPYSYAQHPFFWAAGSMFGK